MADSDFPAIVTANGNTNSADDLPGYMATNKAAIDAQLHAVGAVLFRGFNVPDANAFDAAVQGYGADNFAYAKSLSNAVRVNVTPRVFTANEAPPDTSIYLHHEMAQTPIYPSKLFFYCEIAPDKGGATPICRSDLLLEQMAQETPQLLAAFANKGVRYTNVMPAANDSGSGQGRSWKSTLNAETIAEAEARLAALGYSHIWLDDGSLRATTPVLPAVRTLADGRRTFFNQLIAAFRGWSDSRNTAHKSVRFGDDMPITGADMEPVIAMSEALTHDLAWQAGDVALLDNYLVMHGRRPFGGKRRVLASLVA